jgi:ribosomal protein S18 acetylase RimI-like enzyme
MAHSPVAIERVLAPYAPRGNRKGLKMLEIRLTEGLRTATPADWKQLGSITAEAFYEDPVNLWIFGNTRTMPPVFSELARSVYLPRGICHIHGDSGATMWAHSAQSRELNNLQTMRLVWSLMTKGEKGAAKRGLGAGEAMAREHPAAAHLYLFTIGTRKAARGQGLGKQLIRPMLDAADRAALPCYLENSNPANTGFYVSHGFERMKIFELGPGSPPMEAMWREPRSMTASSE